MMDYKPPFTITNAILKYAASISEKLGKLNFEAEGGFPWKLE